MSKRGIFSFFSLVLFFGLAFSLNAFSPGSLGDSSFSETVLSILGASGIIVGTAFSKNFKKSIMDFAKSSGFIKGDAGKPSGDPYSEKNPPIQKGEMDMKKAEDPAGDDTGNLDEVLDGLKKAITDGSVEMTEDGIRQYCADNGVSDEDCNYIISIVLESADKPAQNVEKSDALIEGGHDEPDGDEFEKSLMKIMKNMGDRIVKAENSLASFQKSTKSEIQKKNEEIKFLKGQLGKYLKEPENPKAPAKDYSNSGAGSSMQMSRPETIAQIKKGMTLNICGLDDLLAYESKGKLPERFHQIPKN